MFDFVNYGYRWWSQRFNRKEQQLQTKVLESEDRTAAVPWAMRCRLVYVRAQGLRTAGFSRTNVRHEMSGVHDAIHDADAPNGPTGIIGQSRCTSGHRLWKATLLSCLIMLNDLGFLCISKTNWIDLRFLLQPSRQSHVVVVLSSYFYTRSLMFESSYSMLCCGAISNLISSIAPSAYH